MVKIVIIHKTGEAITKNILKFDINTLYKKCSFRNDNHFKLHHTWKISSAKYIHVFAKNNGRANSENKFDFPPPIDTILFFGNVAVVKTSERYPTNVNVKPLTHTEWAIIYEKLFGGFEDINSVNSYESDELDNYKPEQLTKQGYLKDGFIVTNEESGSSSEDSNIEYETEDGQESEKDDADLYGDEQEESETILVPETEELLLSDDDNEESDDEDNEVGYELTVSDYEDSSGEWGA